MQDFDYWSDAEIQRVCKVGFTAAGSLVGGAVGGLLSTVTAGAAAPLTVPAGVAYGAVLGFAAGLLVCPRVPREKVDAFLEGRPLSRTDATEVLRAIGQISGARDKLQVLALAEVLRRAHVGRSAAGATGTSGAVAPPTHARMIWSTLPA